MLEMEATREENENGISYKVDPDVWYIIRNTNGVTGFVGVGSDPIPMEDDEVKNIFNIIGMDTSKETIKLDFAEGDFVKILKGSFTDQEGQVAEIDYEHGRVKVMVDIFGRMNTSWNRSRWCFEGVVYTILWRCNLKNGKRSNSNNKTTITSR